MRSTKDRAADLRLRREYHITLEEYEKVFEFQGRVCAICKKRVLTGKARLAVDHGHTDGKLRGLLCWRCNRALAALFDNADSFQAAADYLRNPPFTRVFGRPIVTAPGRVGSKKRAKLLRAMAGKISSTVKRVRKAVKSKTRSV